LVRQTITGRRQALRRVVSVLARKKRTDIVGARVFIIAIQVHTTAISGGSVATEIIGAKIG
jgi:hypothetical protein